MIFAVGWFASKRASRLVSTALERTKIYRAASSFLARITQYTILAVTIIAVLDTDGVQTTSVIAILGSPGIAVRLAIQGNLSHFASGVMILMFYPFTVGKVVTFFCYNGKVNDVGLFATTLNTTSNDKIIIPNSSITSNTIINLTGQGTRRGTVRLSVACGSDLKNVRDALKVALDNTPQILAEPAPIVHFTDLGDHVLIVDLHAHCKSEDFNDMLNDLRSQVYERLNDAKIEIHFWQIVVHSDAKHP